VLAARADGLRYVLRFGGRQHENHMPRRLFQRFQKRIESGIRNLVGFIQDPDLVAVPRRAIACCIAQLPDLVNTAVGGGVNFDDVNRIPGTNFRGVFANSARLRDRFVGRAAIEGEGQDARQGSFADPAMAAEDVAVGDPLLGNGILQSTRNVLLPNDIRKTLWTVLTREDLVTHSGESDYT